MKRTLLAAILSLVVVGATSLQASVPAAEKKDDSAKRNVVKRQGRIAEIDAKEGILTITVKIPVIISDGIEKVESEVEGESQCVLTKDTKVVDARGKEIKEGVKSRKLKPDVPVEVTGEVKEGKIVVQQIKILQDK
jgi:hypothetical protein